MVALRNEKIKFRTEDVAPQTKTRLRTERRFFQSAS